MSNFAPFVFEIPSNVLICGPSQSGKSSLMMALLEDETLWHPKPPDKIFWFYGILTEQIKRLMLSHPRIVFRQGFPGEELKADPRALFDPEQATVAIFDDMSSTTQNSETFCDLLTHTGRHTNTAIFSLEHFLMSDSNRRRNQATQWHCVLLLRNPRTHQQIRVLANQLGIPTMLLQYAYRDTCKEPYGHLLIDVRTGTPTELQLLTNINRKNDKPVYAYCQHG